MHFALRFVELQDGPHSLRAESHPQAQLVRFDCFWEVVKPFSELTKDLPFFGRLPVATFSIFAFRLFCAPINICAKILVMNHEEVVKPSLAQALVPELRIVILRGGLLEAY